MTIYTHLIKITPEELSELFHELYPDYTQERIEQGTVLLVEGSDWEWSVEWDASDSVFRATGDYLGTEESAQAALHAWHYALQERQWLYNLEYELEQNDQFQSHALLHPDYWTVYKAL